MQLTHDQFVLIDNISKTINCDRRTFQTGSILSTLGASKEILLITKGSCRILDPGRQWGMSSVVKVNAPYLVGTLSLLTNEINEEVRASSDCDVIVLGSAPLAPELHQAILSLLATNVCPSELAPLKQLVETNALPIPKDQQTIEVFQRRWQLADLDDIHSESAEHSIFVFADSNQKGFQYGQQLTATAIKQVWETDTPRLLFWRPEDSRQLEDLASQPEDWIEEETFSTVDEKEQINAAPADVDQGRSPSIATVSRRSQDISGGINIAIGKRERDLLSMVRRMGYQPVSGRTPEKQFEAVMTMLVNHFKVPLRRDSLRKVGLHLASIPDGPSLDRLVVIIDQIGLNGKTIAFRAAEASRLPTPSVILRHDKQPQLIVSASSQGLIVIDPTEGVTEVKGRDVEDTYGVETKAIIVSQGPYTPQKRFGLSWMLPFLSQYKVGLTEVFIASFLTQLFALATPLLFQQIIDRVIGEGSTGALGGFAALMVMFMLLELIFSSLRSFQFMEISNRVDIQIGSSIISRLLRLNARYFEKRPVGELSSRLNELEKIRSFLTGTALTVVLDAIFALLYFIVMFFYSPLLAGIILGSIPLLLAVILGLTPITQRLIRQRAEAYSRTQSYMVEVLNGIQTVKLQNSELTARRNWEDRHLDGINKGFRTVLANTTSSNALQLINKSTNIIVIAVGAWLVIDNQLTLGQLIAFRIISGYVTQPILRLASTWNNFQEVSMAVERLGDLVNQPLETSELEINNITMPPVNGEVRLDQVSFGYSSTVRPQLSGVSLDIPAGSFTGIVGQSGCGKSTLLKLIPRLYEPTKGKVLIDGLDVSKVELYSLRRQLGFVPQDCLLFEGSIYSNIAVADPEADTNQVVQAAKLACAHDFIMTLPYGYSTPVGEKGSGLSGGQRQRIALARMLLQNPGMIILDEATSALDVDTEQQVVKNIRSHAKGKTILMITHRLSTLIEADQIVMMHEGKIDSIGTHEELMAKAGRYYALYKQQFGV